MKNYYHILGLTLESNPDEELITSCYKALVKIFHPDVFKGNKKLGEQKIRDINEAYNILKDSKKKKKYDEELVNHLKKQKEDNSANQENEYQSYDNFNAKEFEKDWEVVLDVYPEIEEMRLYLSKFNTQLSFQFQVILITNKSYDDAKQLKQTLLDNFLTIHFGEEQNFIDLAERFFVDGHKDLAVELSRYIKIIGDNDSLKLIKAFFKKFPKAKKLYGDDFENLGGELSFDHLDTFFNKKEAEKAKKNFKLIFWILIIFGILMFIKLAS